MKDIVLVRIDDRLIHGQVMTAWVQYTQAKEVVVVDDIVYKDEFSKAIMKSAMPKKIGLEILNVEKAVEYLNKDEEGNYFILIKTPQVARQLLEKGVKFEKLCVGGMGSKVSRKQFYRNISASEEEVKCMHEINDMGVNVFVQVLPDNQSIDIKAI